MENNNILIIDGLKYFYDIDNNCLIPLDNFESKLEIAEQYDIKEKKKDIQTKFSLDDNSLNNSLKKFEEVSNSNKLNNDNFNGENLDNINEWYMENYDIDFWENILSRKLDKDERKIIHGIWNETSLNVDVKVLQKNIIKYNCYIKSITNNIGNCLFESLASLGVGDNDLGISTHNMIRKSLASVLLLAKTEIGFFPKINLTPEEIFTNANEIEFIKDKKTGEVYLYDYDMMIYDLNSSYSWERLPTEFILMALSRIYQVEIRIYHNSTDFINKINVFENVPENIIRLGQINEEHYFPLLEIPDELKNDHDVINEILNTKIVYEKCLKQFKKWSKIMMDSMISVNNTSKNNNSIDNDNENYIYNENYIDNENYNKTILDNSNYSNSNTDSIIIMRTNKLTNEQQEDYKQISNIEDFDII